MLYLTIKSISHNLTTVTVTQVNSTLFVAVVTLSHNVTLGCHICDLISCN